MWLNWAASLDGLLQGEEGIADVAGGIPGQGESPQENREDGQGHQGQGLVEIGIQHVPRHGHRHGPAGKFRGAEGDERQGAIQGATGECAIPALLHPLQQIGRR